MPCIELQTGFWAYSRPKSDVEHYVLSETVLLNKTQTEESNYCESLLFFLEFFFKANLFSLHSF